MRKQTPGRVGRAHAINSCSYYSPDGLFRQRMGFYAWIQELALSLSRVSDCGYIYVYLSCSNDFFLSLPSTTSKSIRRDSSINQPHNLYSSISLPSNPSGQNDSRIQSHRYRLCPSQRGIRMRYYVDQILFVGYMPRNSTLPVLKRNDMIQDGNKLTTNVD